MMLRTGGRRYCIVSVLHQNKGGIGKLRIENRNRDFPRPSRYHSGFALGKSHGSREISWVLGMDFPIPTSIWWSRDTMVGTFTEDLRSSLLPSTNHTGHHQQFAYFCHHQHHQLWSRVVRGDSERNEGDCSITTSSC